MARGCTHRMGRDPFDGYRIAVIKAQRSSRYLDRYAVSRPYGISISNRLASKISEAGPD